MLLELRIENLLLIERAELRPGDGLTAITGETGAGKTVLAHALDLLLGGKARPGIVRPGAADAYVEGVFELPAGLLDEPQFADLRERVGEDLDEIVLARRVSEKRTTAFVQGRSATAADLQALGGRLVAFFGQHEHRRLTLASAQLELLDGFCGREHLDVRAALAAAHARVREIERALADLRERAGTRDRDLDLLAFEIEEIESLDPTEEEKDALAAERARLRELDGLLAAAGAGAEAIAPSGDALTGRRRNPARRRRAARGACLGRGSRAGRARRAPHRSAARGGGPGGGAAPLRRLARGRARPARRRRGAARGCYDRLERKHGGSVAAVLAHAERCREEHARLAHAEIETERAEAALAEALAERDRLAKKVAAARKKAAPKLAERVREELAALAMEGAAFEVALEPREEVAPTGAERVEFMLAPNPGIPAASIRDAASGGELSRVMLALMTVAGDGRVAARWSSTRWTPAWAARPRVRSASGCARSARAGRCSASLTSSDRRTGRRPLPHREVGRAETALTTVEALEGDRVVAELCRMLGAEICGHGRTPSRRGTPCGRVEWSAGGSLCAVHSTSQRLDATEPPGNPLRIRHRRRRLRTWEGHRRGLARPPPGRSRSVRRRSRSSTRTSTSTRAR